MKRLFLFKITQKSLKTGILFQNPHLSYLMDWEDLCNGKQALVKFETLTNGILLPDDKASGTIFSDGENVTFMLSTLYGHEIAIALPLKDCIEALKMSLIAIRKMDRTF